MAKAVDDATFVALWEWGRERYESLAAMGRALGYENPQAVNNWKRRGVPAQAILAAQALGYQAKATQRPALPSSAKLQARLDGMPEDMRAAFETAMLNVIDALRPSSRNPGVRQDADRQAWDQVKRRVAQTTAATTQKPRPARRTKA